MISGVVVLIVLAVFFIFSVRQGVVAATMAAAATGTAGMVGVVTLGGSINNSGAGAFSLGDISGTVANTIGQLQESDALEAPKLAELLKQLQTVIEAETDLTPKNKEKALKQVKALAEAAQKSTEEEKQDLGDTAITMLKGLISGLPSAAALVEACNKLLRSDRISARFSLTPPLWYCGSDRLTIPEASVLCLD